MSNPENVLDKIVATKRVEIEQARSAQPLEYDRRLVEFFGAMPGAEQAAVEFSRLQEPTPVVVD